MAAKQQVHRQQAAVKADRAQKRSAARGQSQEQGNCGSKAQKTEAAGAAEQHKCMNAQY
jgi:hypothetical protein